MLIIAMFFAKQKVENCYKTKNERTINYSCISCVKSTNISCGQNLSSVVNLLDVWQLNFSFKIKNLEKKVSINFKLVIYVLNDARKLFVLSRWEDIELLGGRHDCYVSLPPLAISVYIHTKRSAAYCDVDPLPRLPH